ncbi:MAG: cell division protein ZapA [Oscillospiraceae bacterium]|nr:cell division protein ZapA [Oscillospiraceae bacterium]
MSNSVTVKICGEEFKLITENSIEYTQAVGMHVNAEMQKMLSTRMGRMDAAIMAALNIADDLFKVRLTDEQLRAQIKSALDAEASAKAEANAFKRENLSLQKKLEKAEKALSKAEKSLQKAQKPDTDTASALPLDEAAMADIVEKSKRPRKTRKAKAEAVKVEAVEEVAVEAPEAETEPAPEVEAEAAPEVEAETEAEEVTETAAEGE